MYFHAEYFSVFIGGFGVFRSLGFFSVFLVTLVRQYFVNSISGKLRARDLHIENRPESFIVSIMPTCVIAVTTPRSEVADCNKFLKEASQFIAGQLGKPEGVCISLMRTHGTRVPCHADTTQ